MQFKNFRRMIIKIRSKWAGYVARMGEVITACIMFIRNSKRGSPLGGYDTKLDFREIEYEVLIRFI
jgi:hypothetical protein